MLLRRGTNHYRCAVAETLGLKIAKIAGNRANFVVQSATIYAQNGCVVIENVCMTRLVSCDVRFEYIAAAQAVKPQRLLRR